jgi:hypothetical protein
VRSLRRPPPPVYLIEIGRRWRTASSLRASLSGSTRRILAAVSTSSPADDATATGVS